MWHRVSISTSVRPCLRGVRFAAAALLVAALCAGCHTEPAVDTKPLDAAGMSYESVKQLQALNVSTEEVAQLAKARGAGFSDAACLQITQMYRARRVPFDAGEAIAGLLGAGASENLVMDLARLNQLGLSAGELEAMRLAGLSDEILLTVARRRAADQAVLSGASLAGLKNLGVSSYTLLVLVQRGVPESQAAAIMSWRRHGANDAQILRQFSGS
jgi:cytochrome c553